MTRRKTIETFGVLFLSVCFRSAFLYKAMSVEELSQELWEFRLRHSPEFSIFKGIIPEVPQLDSLTVEAFAKRKVLSQGQGRRLGASS